MDTKFDCIRNANKCGLFGMRKTCNGCMYSTCIYCKHYSLSIIECPCCDCYMRGISKGAGVVHANGWS